MSTDFLLSFGIISFLLLMPCCSLYVPINGVIYYENERDVPAIDNNEILLLNGLALTRSQRSALYYPRESRNTWFRVSTYQHFKPAGSEQTPSGDNVLRWGRSSK